MGQIARINYLLTQEPIKHVRESVGLNFFCASSSSCVVQQSICAGDVYGYHYYTRTRHPTHRTLKRQNLAVSGS